MTVYAYKGFDARGKPISGLRDAESPRALRQHLRKDGVMINQVTENTQAPSAGGKVAKSRGRVSAQELAMSTRQLATLVGAAIPLVDALAALADQVEHPALRATIAQIRQRVNEGAALGDAMAEHPRIFNTLFVNMIRAGETSGALDIVLNRLSDFTENQAKLQQKIIGTMFYPIIMIGMAFGVVGILMTFVIPKITRLFESQKAALPLPTMVLIGLSNFIKDYWWLAILMVFGAVTWVRRYYATPKGRERIDARLLHVPIFGELIRMLAVTRFSRTLATLLSSSVPLLTAFDIVKSIITNKTLAAAIEDARSAIQQGESIAAPLKRSGEFPPIVTHMIAVGEKSGQLEDMLFKIADAYDAQVDARLIALTSILEPLIIVIMGLVVGFIVFSIMLPMLQLSSFAK